MYTPGPWTLHCAPHADNTGGYDYAIIDKDKRVLAEVFEHVGQGNETGYEKRPAHNNAKLIAAAPDLLKALQKISKISERPTRNLVMTTEVRKTDIINEIALQAIKKATQ